MLLELDLKALKKQMLKLKLLKRQSHCMKSPDYDVKKGRAAKHLACFCTHKPMQLSDKKIR